MSMSDTRLNAINQMVLAVIFGVGLLCFLFALVFSPQKMDQVTITIVSNLLSVLGTVVVMQNTHFFKGTIDTAPVPPLLPGVANEIVKNVDPVPPSPIDPAKPVV